MRISFLLFAIAAALTLTGCSTIRRHLQPPPMDVVDRDFMATVTSPSPNIISIEVRKTNPRAKKKILLPTSGMAFTLVDPSGKTLESRKGYGIERLKTIPSSSGEFDRVRVVTRIDRKTIPPGVYTVTPNVRITESGKDAVFSQRQDGGSVDVPAGNSTKVTLK